MRFLINAEGAAGLVAGLESLRRGEAALDAVEAAIRPVEADPKVHSVGLGGWTNLLGEIECDAAIVDGSTRECGAVAGLRGHLHAISIARAVMARLPHVLLVGEGAARFAAEIGAERAEMVTEEARDAHDRWLAERLDPSQAARLREELARHRAATGATRGGGDARGGPEGATRAPLIDSAWASALRVAEKGTVICLAIDAAGRMAAGASSSGWAYKYPGRVGDSGVIGAGIYADSRHGACGCTHTGEMTIRAGTARAVVLAMRHGASVEEACRDAVRDLRALRGGLQGPVAIHAIDREGRACAVCTHPSGLEPGYFLWEGGESLDPPRRQAARAL